MQTLNIIKVLASTSWGADRASLMKIYKSIVRYKIDYGAPIYGSAAKSILKILDVAHNQGLRIDTGAFRTSPISSLHVSGGEPSLELRRQRLSHCYFYKIKSVEFHPMCSKVINPIYGSLFSIKLSFTPTFGFRIGEILRTFKIQDFPVVVSINGPPPWQEEHFDFIDDFVHFLKQSTSDMIFQKLFL
ncbi:hypothetical protein AVEN_268765-1 [Araneus ventricosus]|uniref:Uncharacterized protein n=1 Tax=Araneus ventricosus TaxID=182803 RepID=A0A4Y2UWX2_ARAVE|nr:hypothetical protein AVEN_44159-1 [Araneus ventricosus]GBO17403.1 hypothetical protein AVEN_268765-1 [Araneus ventricosus]